MDKARLQHLVGIILKSVWPLEETGPNHSYISDPMHNMKTLDQSVGEWISDYDAKHD